MVLLLLLFLYGCRTEYVPVRVVNYDSLMIEKLIRDSVYVRDSVFVNAGSDTIYIYKDKYVYMNKERVDTVFIEREREREVPIPVERELSWWERVKIEYAEWIFSVLIAVALLIWLRRWMRRRIKKHSVD